MTATTYDTPANPLRMPSREEVAWQDWGMCSQTSPDAFFPEKGQPNAAAKRVCASCPVQPECLEYAIVHEERYGVWGGTSERARRQMIAARRRKQGKGVAA